MFNLTTAYSDYIFKLVLGICLLLYLVMKLTQMKWLNTGSILVDILQQRSERYQV